MLVMAKEGTALCLHKYFDLGCEFLVLPQCKPLTNVVYVVVSVQPFLCVKPMRPLINLVPHILEDSQGL